MADPQWIGVGRIRGSHGVHGAVKIEPWAPASGSVLRHARRWRLVESADAEAPVAVAGGAVPARQALEGRREEGPVADAGGAVHAPVSGSRAAAPSSRTAPSLPGRSRPLVLPQPALTREQAMALKGVELQVDRADFPPADEDEFYHADLIGCEVIGQGGARLGTVVAVDDHGAQQVLRLDDGLLIPFVEAIVTTVDLAARRIEVDWAADWR